MNDPGRTETSSPYVPLGSLDSIEDPRLIRVGHYEQAATGRHDAAKILGPFVDAFLARARKTPRVAVLLHDAGSRNKIAQTILEMIRGGIADLHVQLAVFHHADAELDAGFVQRLGFPVRRLQGTEQQRDEALRRALVDGQFDYVILFESSGMYNGEDIAGLASFLRSGRLDAVWGSRRLSVRDIHESYRLKYRKKAFLGAASYAGSHVLSLACLALYGRYVSDTLSGARAVRTGDALALDGPLTDKLANQRLLSTLLRRRAEMLEVPVQFFSISPDRVRRTTIADGLRAALVLIAGRVRQPRVPASPAAADAGHPSRAWIGS